MEPLPPIDWVTFGLNLQQTREEQNRIQFDFATEVGISDRALREIEDGRAKPSGETLLHISIALDIDPRVLLKPTTREPRGPGRPKSPKPPTDSNPPPSNP